MILHYLGLDHIGHVHGPFSPLIKTKLKEMDNVIAKIHFKVQEWVGAVQYKKYFKCTIQNIGFLKVWKSQCIFYIYKISIYLLSSESK